VPGGEKDWGGGIQVTRTSKPLEKGGTETRKTVQQLRGHKGNEGLEKLKPKVRPERKNNDGKGEQTEKGVSC